MDKVRINEVMEHQPLETVEGSKPGILCTLKGCLAKVGRSRNNKNYSEELWSKAIRGRYITESIENGTLLGELDHPEDRDDPEVKAISHRITELHMNGDCVEGTVEVLDTPAGRIVNTLLQLGAKVGISARALGTYKPSVTNEGMDLDPDTFNLITFDFVHRPGFEGARLAINESCPAVPEDMTSLYVKAVESMDMDQVNLFMSVMGEQAPIREALDARKASLLADKEAEKEEILKPLREELALKTEEAGELKKQVESLTAELQAEREKPPVERVVEKIVEKKVRDNEAFARAVNDVFTLKEENKALKTEHQKELAELEGECSSLRESLSIVSDNLNKACESSSEKVKSVRVALREALLIAGYAEETVKDILRADNPLEKIKESAVVKPELETVEAIHESMKVKVTHQEETKDGIDYSLSRNYIRNNGGK